MAYIADIFSILNEPNLKLQGKNNNIFQHVEHIQGFLKNYIYGKHDLKVISKATKWSQHLLQHFDENITNKDKQLEIKSTHTVEPRF